MIAYNNEKEYIMIIQKNEKNELILISIKSMFIKCCDKKTFFLHLMISRTN